MGSMALENPLITNTKKISVEEVTPDMFFDFILAATTYGSWKRPLELRDYQMKVAWAVIDSVLNNRGYEITAMFSRQSGKTTTISGATNFFLLAVPSFVEKFNGIGIRTGIFGPKKEQADYAFDMLKTFIDTGFIQDYFNTHVVLSNSKEVRLSNGSRCHCESASKNASIERLTLDLAILEEAQSIDDVRILNSIYPMCSSTNGTRVLIGTPTPERTGYFYKITSRRSNNNFKADWRECAKYSRHYDTFVQKEMRRHGPNSDYFKTQYELQWITNVVNLCTIEELTKLRNGPIIRASNEPVIIGLDTARITDSTVLTVIKSPTVTSKPHICFWAEWQGDDTRTQAKEISEILKRFPRMELMNVDTLHGVGHSIVDLLPQDLPIVRYPMESYRQATMWQLVREAIVNEAFTYPDVEDPERFKFEEQLTSLVTKLSGDRFKVEAPSGMNDDYADSFALAWVGIWETYYTSSSISSIYESNFIKDAQYDSEEENKAKEEQEDAAEPIRRITKPRLSGSKPHFPKPKRVVK